MVAATLNISHNISDNASGVPLIFDIDLTIVDVPGTTGQQDDFL